MSRRKALEPDSESPCLNSVCQPSRLADRGFAEPHADEGLVCRHSVLWGATEATVTRQDHDEVSPRL